MGKIFKGQSALRIMLKTFCDLEDVSLALIKFKKPDGSFGELEAAIGDSALGIIFHEVIEGELDMSGWWLFWAFITFADDRTAAGEAAKVFIWNEGSG
jgi:hypothetical protein